MIKIIIHNFCVDICSICNLLLNIDESSIIL